MCKDTICTDMANAGETCLSLTTRQTAVIGSILPTAQSCTAPYCVVHLLSIGVISECEDQVSVQLSAVGPRNRSIVFFSAMSGLVPSYFSLRWHVENTAPLLTSMARDCSLNVKHDEWISVMIGSLADGVVLGRWIKGGSNVHRGWSVISSTLIFSLIFSAVYLT